MVQEGYFEYARKSISHGGAFTRAPTRTSTSPDPTPTSSHPTWRRGHSVEVGTFRAGKVDFVARRANETVYVHVCETMIDPATRERELGPLRAITDAFPKCVITLDRYGPGTTSDGIKVLGAIDWLLGR